MGNLLLLLPLLSTTTNVSYSLSFIWCQFIIIIIIINTIIVIIIIISFPPFCTVAIPKPFYNKYIS